MPLITHETGGVAARGLASPEARDVREMTIPETFTQTHRQGEYCWETMERRVMHGPSMGADDAHKEEQA